MRDLLGRTSIVTTERYDNQREEALLAAAKRLETGEIFKFFSRSTRPELESGAENPSKHAGKSLSDLTIKVGVDKGIEPATSGATGGRSESDDAGSR
jgi:hypothetical protein